jgi:hypothetical protein
MSSPVCRFCRKPLASGANRGRKKQYCGAPCRAAESRRKQKKALADSDTEYSVVIREHIALSGLPLREVARRLEAQGYPTSIATISNWQVGQAVPPPTARNRDLLLALERTLDAKVMTIARKHPQFERLLRARTVDAARLPTGGPSDRACHDVLKNLLEERIERRTGFSRQSLLIVRVKQHLTVEERIPRSIEFTFDVMPMIEDIKQYWYIHTFELCAPSEVRAEPQMSRGETLYEDVRIGDESAQVRIAATQLCWPRPLPRLSVTRFGFRLAFQAKSERDALAEQTLKRAFTTSPACRRADLAVTFVGERPATVARCRWPHDRSDGDPVERTPIADNDGTVVTVLRNPVRAAYGFIWTWPGPDQRTRRTNP